MSEIPTLKLFRLRELGWTLWDPIGLAPAEEAFEDEYDSYLLQVASRLWHAQPDDRVCQYLVQIEQEHMGMGGSSSAKERAMALVSAVNAYLAELRGEA